MEMLESYFDFIGVFGENLLFSKTGSPQRH
jgi:hypothetical protein